MVALNRADKPARQDSPPPHPSMQPLTSDKAKKKVTLNVGDLHIISEEERGSTPASTKDGQSLRLDSTNNNNANADSNDDSNSNNNSTNNNNNEIPSTRGSSNKIGGGRGLQPHSSLHFSALAGVRGAPPFPSATARHFVLANSGHDDAAAERERQETSISSNRSSDATSSAVAVDGNGDGNNGGSSSRSSSNPDYKHRSSDNTNNNSSSSSSRIAGASNAAEVDDVASISVEILSAKALRNRDYKYVGGLSDPYCELFRDGRSEPLTRTKTVQNTLDPIWDHPALEIPDFTMKDKLVFRVFDSDDDGRNGQALGMAELSASSCLPHGFSGELELTTNGSTPDARLKVAVKVNYIPKCLRRTAMHSARVHDLEDEWKEGAEVRIRIVEARNLRDADKFGRNNKSDPYCVCYRGSETHHVLKTKTISDDLNPYWNEDFITVPHVPCEGPALTFEVRDSDPGGRSDLLGRVTLDAKYFLPDGLTDEKLSLQAAGTDAALHVQIRVVKMPASKAIPGGLKGLCMTWCCGVKEDNAIEMNFESPQRHFPDIPAAIRETVLEGAELFDNFVEEVQVELEDVEMKIEHKFENALNLARFYENFAIGLAEILTTWFKERIRDQLSTALDLVPPRIKNALNMDPDMPKGIWRFECRLVDALWPRLRREMAKDLGHALHLDTGVRERQQMPSQPNPDPISRYVRYQLFPFDKSFFGRSMSPLWILITIMAVFPVSGVSALAFLIVFFVIDKTDEYQVCTFLVEAKAAQFVAHGFLRTLAIYLAFLDCVVSNGDPVAHDCGKRGPAAFGPAWFVMGGWLVQIVLPWVALLCIVAVTPWCKPKSLEDSDSEEEDAAGDATQEKNKIGFLRTKAKHLYAEFYDKDKRHLRNLMLWDAVCVVVIIGSFLGYIAADGFALDDFLARQSFLGVQVAYGWCALPFVFFCLPGAEKLLIHSRRTGYDKRGWLRYYRGAERVERPPPDTVWDQLMDLDRKHLMHQCLAAVQGQSAGDDKSHEFRHEALKAPIKCSSCTHIVPYVGDGCFACTYCWERICVECNEVHQGQCETRIQRAADEAASALQTKLGDEEKAAMQKAHHNELLKWKWDGLAGSFDTWKSMSTLFAALAKGESTEAKTRLARLCRVWVKRRSSGFLMYMMDQMPTLLKWTLDVPDMPAPIRRAKDAAVDKVWLELDKELMYAFRVAIDGKDKGVDDVDDSTPGVNIIRAKLRYAFKPYNLSIWGQIKLPLFWVLQLLPLIPISLFVPLVFCIIFIVIDKTNKFQLVDFILRFKGTQFLSFGLVKNLVGVYTYIGCIGVSDEAVTSVDMLRIPREERHSCAETGPGKPNAIDSLWVQLGGLSFQILLTWTCFALLPLSKDLRREGKDDIDNDPALAALAEANDNSQAEPNKFTKNDLRNELTHAGKKRLIMLGVYDFVCTLGCLVVFFSFLAQENGKATWIIEQVMFALQVAYGYMAFPFLICGMPGVRTVTTHSVATGYDERGRLRVIVGPNPKDTEKRRQEQEEQLAAKQHREGMAGRTSSIQSDEDEAESLFQRIGELYTKLSEEG